MTTFAEAHAQRVAEFRDLLFEAGLLETRYPTYADPVDFRIDTLVDKLFRKWTAKAVAEPAMKPKPFVCEGA